MFSSTISRQSKRNNRLNQISVHGGVVYLAGVTAADRSQDIRGQTAQVLARIEELLQMAGSSTSHILFANVWLKDAGDMETFNTLWDAWIPADSLPGRTTVHSSLASDVVLVEIVVQAAVAG